MEVLHDAVEHAVDVRGAFGRAVHLGDVEIFVERDAQGNGGEGEYLGEGDLHDDDVHHGEAVELPVARVVANEAAQLGVARKRGVEEVLRKAAVVVGTEFGQQGHLLVALFREALDGFQHKRVDDLDRKSVV